MAELKDYSTTAASNNSASPNGMPENMAPSGVNNSWREGIARIKRWYEDVNAVNSLAGGTTAYTLAASRTISAYAAGDVFLAVCNATNTGASTLNVDTVGAKSIVDTSNVALGAGDLVINGIYWFAYDATNDTFICLNPATGGSGAFDINGLSAETTMADADVLPFYDDGVSNKKITVPNARIQLHPWQDNGIHIESVTDTTGGVASTYKIITLDTEISDAGGTFAANKWTPAIIGKYFVCAGVNLTGPSGVNLTNGDAVGLRIAHRSVANALYNNSPTTKFRIGEGGTVDIMVCGVIDYGAVDDYISIEAQALPTNWEVDASNSYGMAGWRIA